MSAYRVKEFARTQQAEVAAKNYRLTIELISKKTDVLGIPESIRIIECETVSQDQRDIEKELEKSGFLENYSFFACWR